MAELCITYTNIYTVQSVSCVCLCKLNIQFFFFMWILISLFIIFLLCRRLFVCSFFFTSSPAEKTVCADWNTLWKVKSELLCIKCSTCATVSAKGNLAVGWCQRIRWWGWENRNWFFDINKSVAVPVSALVSGWLRGVERKKVLPHPCFIIPLHPCLFESKVVILSLIYSPVSYAGCTVFSVRGSWLSESREWKKKQYYIFYVSTMTE